VLPRDEIAVNIAPPELILRTQRRHGAARRFGQRGPPEAARKKQQKIENQTVSELLDSALAGTRERRSLCYVYDAEVHTLTLERASELRKLAVQVKSSSGAALVNRTYRDLLAAEFSSTSRKTGKRSEFRIVLGTRGALRGVPLEIRYQPNWWFEVVPNVRPESIEAAGETQLPGGGM
jgi:hypothetical protein